MALAARLDFSSRSCKVIGGGVSAIFVGCLVMLLLRRGVPVMGRWYWAALLILGGWVTWFRAIGMVLHCVKMVDRTQLATSQGLKCAVAGGVICFGFSATYGALWWPNVHAGANPYPGYIPQSLLLLGVFVLTVLVPLIETLVLVPILRLVARTRFENWCSCLSVGLIAGLIHGFANSLHHIVPVGLLFAYLAWQYRLMIRGVPKFAFAFTLITHVLYNSLVLLAWS